MYKTIYSCCSTTKLLIRNVYEYIESTYIMPQSAPDVMACVICLAHFISNREVRFVFPFMHCSQIYPQLRQTYCSL